MREPVHKPRPLLRVFLDGDASRGFPSTPRGRNSLVLLCGIGFTMSLFIGLLAFAGNPLLQEEAKIGILAGSAVAAILGPLVLLAASRRAP